MTQPVTIPLVDVSTLDCKGGNFKCPLGTMGCSAHQISGQPASHVAESHSTNMKCLLPVAPLGPGQYDLMIIGELPGVNDDRLDMIWQDDSGERIIDWLHKAGHDLDRVWMTKIVKCRPRQRGRKPSTTETNICRDEYLRKEIELIQPKVVMLVGAPALKAFNLSGLGSINAVHGRVFEARFARQPDMKDADFEATPIYKLIPTPNPAAFFYHPNKPFEARIGHDYVVAKAILDDVEPTAHFVPDFELVDSDEKLVWLASKLLNTNMFGWDTEQSGLSFRKSGIICYQFAWGWNDCAVLPINLHDPDSPEDDSILRLKPGYGAMNEDLVTAFMRKVFLTENVAKCAHNHKFDINVLRWGYGVKIAGFLYDTWTMKHLRDEQGPHNLAHLCDVEFSWGDYEAARRAITGSGKTLTHGFDWVPDPTMHPYGATDALGTYRLGCLEGQRCQAKPNLWRFHMEESEPMQRCLARAEYKGAFIHTDTMDVLRDKYESKLKILRSTMRGTVANPDFNPASSPQVISAFESMGVPDVDLEEESAVSGKSANKNKLIDIVEKNVQPQAGFAANVMKYRNTNKMIGTYLQNCKVDLDNDGRVRYSWVIAGPVTGRLSCRFFHQIPKIDEKVVCDKDGKYIMFRDRLRTGDLVMRDMFIAPKGYKYVYGDFSQVELRIVAIISNDREMLLIMADPNGDLHAATAYEFIRTQWPGMLETDVSKFNRTEVGKRVNFGLIYGSEGFSLVKTGKWQDVNLVERNFTWSMLENGMAAWKKRFTGVGNFIDMTPDMVRAAGGTATNVFGRERHFGPLLNLPNKWERERAEREAINFFVQSVATSITNRTIIAVDKMLAQYNLGDDIVCTVNTVHDSVGYEVRDSHAEWFTEALKTIAARPIPQLNNASFRMDVGVGDNWTDAEMAA